MAGWPIIEHGSDSDLAENIDLNKNKSLVLDGDYDDFRLDDRLRKLFDEALLRFLEAVGENGTLRPFPAMLGCGEPVDLLRLFCVVRTKGGYGSVSRNRLWGYVAHEMGVWIRASSSVKLVYHRYLSEFERRFVSGRKSRFGSSFGFLLPELEDEFRDLLDEAGCDSDGNVGDDEDRVGLLNPRSVDIESGIEKAKLSVERLNGENGGPLNKEELDGKELHAQAMRAEEALMQRRRSDPKSNDEESQPPKKIKTHPSLHEDCAARNRDRLRRSKRLPVMENSHLCPSEDGPAEADVPASAAKVLTSKDEPEKKCVSVGPFFQANVPEWTGVVSESDSKWLGTKIWPLEHKNNGLLSKITPIGKGRPNFCDCSLPGSSECVRFHIAEARVKLKLELGSAFFSWKFSLMGEEVALRWTEEEEIRCKDVIRSKARNSFWAKKVRRFLRKTRENMVSYYFNVYVIRKRSYQNRVTLNNIDSDDEAECGSIGGHFGNSLTGIVTPPCVENRQCTDYEDTGFEPGPS